MERPWQPDPLRSVVAQAPNVLLAQLPLLVI